MQSYKKHKHETARRILNGFLIYLTLKLNNLLNDSMLFNIIFIFKTKYETNVCLYV